MQKHSFSHSVKAAFHGLLWIFKSERNFKIELFGLFINILLIFVLNLNRADILFILILCGLVLISEIINTAIEKLCDYVKDDYHPKIGLIKDISAAAVLLAVIFAIIAGAIIYLPYLQKMVS